MKMLSPTKTSFCLWIILKLSALMFSVDAAIYNQNLAIKFKGSNRNDFFGYSVALQQQTGTPRVVIGAPKNGPNKVGSVYVCPVVETDTVSDKSCESYTIDGKTISNTQTIHFQNNMFGACLDGGISKFDDIVVGAPKLIEKRTEVDYVTGGIFKLSDILQNKYIKFPEISDGLFTKGSIYHYGYAQFGFSMHNVNSSEYLYGTPGFDHWRGEAFRAYMTDSSTVPASRRVPLPRLKKRELVERADPFMNLITDEYDAALSGYAVTSGRFFDHTSYVVGLPNAKDMSGDVKLYYFNEKTQSVSEKRVSGLNLDIRAMGEHFGSALAASDINGDGYDDLFVGAPNAAHDEEFDNGKVYVYISNGHSGFDLRQTLIGSAKSRCGTSIANLGKITLDIHDSIAVGCPYENNTGVVRVYVWVDEKLMLDSAVSFADFTSFGYSLSRAVDIDSNHIPDLAVGAYKSDAIAILKAKSVFYYKVTITHTPIQAASETEILQITICISLINSNDPIPTTITVKFDDRIKDSYESIERITISTTNGYCKVHKKTLSKNLPNYDPLLLTVELQEDTCDTCPVRSPTYPSIFREKIPFTFDCKGNICIPNLHIVINFEQSIVVGKEDKHTVSVTVHNSGDPAYVCKVDIAPSSPISISPLNPKRCVNNVCDFSQIKTSIKQEYILDFSGWSMYNPNLDLHVTAKCVNFSTESIATLKLRYESKLMVEGPKLTKQYDSLNASTFNVEGATIFHVINEGPSNLESTSFLIRIPRYVNDEQIIDIYRPDGDLCQPVDEMYDEQKNYEGPVDMDSEPAVAGFGKATSLENTISCDNPGVRCMEIRCQVMNIRRNDVVIFNIPTRINISEILKNYRSTFTIVSTIERESTNEKSIAELDIIDRQTIFESVNVWIIVGSVLGALLVLAIVVGVLYKLGFFNRPEHERLIEQQNMDGTLEEVEMRRPVIDGEAPTAEGDLPSEVEQEKIQVEKANN